MQVELIAHVLGMTKLPGTPEDKTPYCVDCQVTPLPVGNLYRCDGCIVALIDWLEKDEQERVARTALAQFNLDQQKG